MAKNAKQQAAVAMSMKAAGKKPKMGAGGMHMMPNGSMMKDSMMKKGGYASATKKPTMAKGGAAGTALKNALVKAGYKKGGSAKK